MALRCAALPGSAPLTQRWPWAWPFAGQKTKARPLPQCSTLVLPGPLIWQNAHFWGLCMVSEEIWPEYGLHDGALRHRRGFWLSAVAAHNRACGAQPPAPGRDGSAGTPWRAATAGCFFCLAYRSQLPGSARVLPERQTCAPATGLIWKIWKALPWRMPAPARAYPVWRRAAFPTRSGLAPMTKKIFPVRYARSRGFCPRLTLSE